MISMVVVAVLFVLSIGLVFRYGFKGLAASVGLIGSDTDSAGPLYWIINHFPFYKIPVRFMVLSGTAIALYRLLKYGLWRKINRNFLYYYVLPLVLLSIIIVCLGIIRGQGLIVAFSELIWLGVPFFFLWLAGSIKASNNQAFVFFVLVQGLVAMFVVLAGAITADINGASYASIIGGEAFLVDPRDMINAPISFFNFNKHDLSVMKFGQFHNPNALGVYAVALVFVSWYAMMRSHGTKRHKYTFLLWLFPMTIGVILWLNSLTRGPVLLLFIWGVIHLLLRIRGRHGSSVILLLVILGFFGVLLVVDQTTLFRYLVVQSDDISITSRLGGYLFAFNAMMHHPFVGQLATAEDPVPHILPLKIAAYYGVPAAILITTPFLHAGGQIIKQIRSSIGAIRTLKLNYIVGLFCIIVGAMTTNGVIVYVLFWAAFAEIVKELGLFTASSTRSSSVE